MPNKVITREVNQNLECLNCSPGFLYLVDVDGQVIWLNENLTNSVGIRESEVIGKKFLCPESEIYEPIYRRHNLSTLTSGQLIKCLEPIGYPGDTTSVVITHKKPFIHRGKVIGVFGNSLELSSSQLPHTDHYSPEIIFFDILREKTLSITQRQKHVLFYLIQGLLTKQVADKMCISHRTVEHHIEAIKDANGYKSTKEILLAVKAI